MKRFVVFALPVALYSCGLDPVPELAPAATPDEASPGGSFNRPATALAECSEAALAAAYSERIEPLLTDDRPSSCNECHLAGIDLSLYAKGEPCQTMACMASQGLVDLEDPASSVVLDWVRRAEPQGLITQEVIDLEYQGVRAWIEFMADCGAQQCGTPSPQPCGEEPDLYDCDLTLPSGPGDFEDPGGCSDLAIETLWRVSVYPWRGRCYPCHFQSWKPEPDTVNFDAPRWVVAGECASGSLLSLRNVEAGGYIDVDAPLASPFLLKPLSEAAGGVPHGGGEKIHGDDDPLYADFATFAQRYAECFGDAGQ